MKGPDGNLVHQIRNRQDGKFELTLPTPVRTSGCCSLAQAHASALGQGKYSACIRNYGRHNTEVVYHAFVGHAGAAVDHGKVTTGAPLLGTAPASLLADRTAPSSRRADQLQPMRNTLRSLQQVMRQLLEEQKYQRARDTVHIASA